MKFKTFFYWASLVMPIIDIIHGVCLAIGEIPDNVKKIHENRLYLDEIYRFENEMNYQDMDEQEFYDKYNNSKTVKGKKKNG